MATRKENLKSLFSNTRTRLIIIFTMVLLIIGIIIGVTKFFSTPSPSQGAGAEIGRAPVVRSVPGQFNPTPEYAKLQEIQNISQAKKAAQEGTSAIPTIIRLQKIGEGATGLQRQGQGVGFQALSREDNLGPQKSLWLQELKKANCNKTVVDKIRNEGASLADLRKGCSCVQLKENGFQLSELKQVCSCKQLRAAGFNARQLKEQGYFAGQLRLCGFDACELRNAGFTAQQLKDGGFSDGELRGAGYSSEEIRRAGGLPDGFSAEDIRKAGCSPEALRKLREAGVTAAAIVRISGCTAKQLKDAGYTARELKNAGFSAAELKEAGFTPSELKKAGFSARDLLDAGFTPERLEKAGYTQAQIRAAEQELTSARDKISDCSVDSLRKARAAGVSASEIKRTLGCSAKQMKDAGYTAKELRDAGYTAAQLKAAGFSAKQLKDAGFSAKQLKDAGFSAKQLKGAGFSAKQLKGAGISAKQLKDAGFSAKQLKDAGFSAKQLKDAGFSAKQLKDAGFSTKQLKDAGFSTKQLKDAGFTSDELGLAELPGQRRDQTQQSKLPSVSSGTSAQARADASSQQLQRLLKQQQKQFDQQKYQTKINQRSSDMRSAANEAMGEWKQVSTQTFVAGEQEKKSNAPESESDESSKQNGNGTGSNKAMNQSGKHPSIKTGDIMFAVIDTSVNSDEPGPILATIVSGPYKGSKLIGSFTTNKNSGKMTIRFTTISIPGDQSTQSISAYAIDPNTARTALSSRTDNHYLLRYGSLFASTFMQGFGNAFQSANTTVTIGGTGGGDNITVQNGIGRSALENAVIALATVGKSWSQYARQNMNRQPTIEVFSGTSIGILFTQDASLS